MTNDTANVRNADGVNVNVASLRSLLSLGLTVAQAGEVQHLRERVLAPLVDVATKYGSLRDKISAEKRARRERAEVFARLYSIADAIGRDAAETHRPQPMVVQDMMSGHVYEPVMDGVCGFAWVTVRPATSAFARWAKEHRGWSKAYGGGLQLWVHGYGQSMERKEQYARAFARVLVAGGIAASTGSRMD